MKKIINILRPKIGALAEFPTPYKYISDHKTLERAVNTRESFSEFFIHYDKVIIHRQSTGRRKRAISMKSGTGSAGHTRGSAGTGLLTKTAIRQIWKFQKLMLLMGTKTKCWHKKQNRYVWAILFGWALTIPFYGKPVSCSVANSLAKRFTRWLEQTKGIKVWLIKGEYTENEQPHFHFMLINYLHYREVQRKWNQLLHDAGLLDRYFEEHGHHDAPSVTYVPICSNKEASAYLASYLKKNTQNSKPWDGKVYRASAALRKQKPLRGVYCKQQKELLKEAVKLGIMEYEEVKFDLHHLDRNTGELEKGGLSVLVSQIWKLKPGYEIEDILSDQNRHRLNNLRRYYQGSDPGLLLDPEPMNLRTTQKNMSALEDQFWIRCS